MGRILVLAALLTAVNAAGEGAHFATGIKIGEVTPDSAIVWVRLTRDAEAAPRDGALPEVAYEGPGGIKTVREVGRNPQYAPIVRFPDGVTVENLAGAAPGAQGEVRVRYKTDNEEEWQETEWLAVDPDRDFTRQFQLTSLRPLTRYTLRIEARGGAFVEGAFRTAPAPDTEAPVTFAVSTGQRYPHMDLPGRGFKIYGEMLKLDPDFFVHTGDILYYDELAKSLALARWHWQRMYSLPTNRVFHARVPSYFIKDDHDTWQNDCWPAMESRFMGDFTFAQGQAVFLEQVPMKDRTWRQFRWGRDLEVWLVEGRDYRSPNDAPDGPEKSIWGGEQKEWFKKTVIASDATFRMLISPTPLVGPDRESKGDNHANANFAHEGRELREFLAAQKNMVVICGDRHWQYVSVDAATGLREYSCGPASDEHAGGWKQDDRRPEHRYLNVVGGFLAVSIIREDGVPAAVFRHHGVDGTVLNQDRLIAH